MKQELLAKLAEMKPRSAWSRGVRDYAMDILADACEQACRYTEKDLLNGASDWKEYSYGGCAFCYNRIIASRLCTPSELRKTNGGMKWPNKRESWLGVQARALVQAWMLIDRLQDDMRG